MLSKSDDDVILFLRNTRDSSMENRNFNNALFWARKCFSISNSMKDLFVLVLCYFYIQEYTKAESLIPFDLSPSTVTKDYSGKFLLLSIQIYVFIRLIF